MIEVKPDGGVLIAGGDHDLRTLIDWLWQAVETGYAQPAFIADRGLAEIEIRREGER